MSLLCFLTTKYEHTFCSRCTYFNTNVAEIVQFRLPPLAHVSYTYCSIVDRPLSEFLCSCSQFCIDLHLPHPHLQNVFFNLKVDRNLYNSQPLLKTMIADRSQCFITSSTHTLAADSAHKNTNPGLRDFSRSHRHSKHQTTGSVKVTLWLSRDNGRLPVDRVYIALLQRWNKTNRTVTHKTKNA
jgi:hypothetical protein